MESQFRDGKVTYEIIFTLRYVYAIVLMKVSLQEIMRRTVFTLKFQKETLESRSKYENFERQIRVPFIVYADFESAEKPIVPSEPDSKVPFTKTR